jgi:hypothetical protein
MRKAVAARVKVTWIDLNGSRVETQGMLEDVSPGGASMRVRESMAAGSRLEVKWPGRDFSGTVRYCKPSGMDYILGIQKDAQGPEKNPEAYATGSALERRQ